MQGVYIPVDEFNTIIISNLVAWKLKKQNPDVRLATVCNKEYKVLFNKFDSVFELPRGNNLETPVDFLAGDIDARARDRLIALRVLESNNITLLDHNHYDHLLREDKNESIYTTVLRNSCEYLQEEGAMIISETSDMALAESYIFSTIKKKDFDLIIGRNRKIHKEHNNLLVLQILRSLLSGRAVINATFPQPRLPLQKFFRNYHELSSEYSDYGISVALMEKAKETILIGNAGGASIHMLTNSNLRLVGLMNWVNGDSYKFEGRTLFETRKMVGLPTSHTWVGETPRNLLRHFVTLISNAGRLRRMRDLNPR